jgi:hypothetical protein
LSTSAAFAGVLEIVVVDAVCTVADCDVDGIDTEASCTMSSRNNDPVQLTVVVF